MANDTSANGNNNGSKKRSFKDFDATNDFLASIMGDENPACLQAAKAAVDTSGDADFLASMTFASGACPCCVGGASMPPPKRTKKESGKSLLSSASSGQMTLWEWTLKPSWEEERPDNNSHLIFWVRQLPLGWELSWKTTNASEWMPLPHWNEGDAFLFPKSDSTIQGFRIARRKDSRDTSNPPPETEEAILYICRFCPDLITTPRNESDEMKLSWDNIALQVAMEAVPLFRNENPNSQHPPYQRLVGHLGEMIALGLDLVDQA